MKKILIILGICGVIAAVVAIVVISMAEDTVSVNKRRIEIKTVVQSVTASGKIQPVLKVDISAYVSGEIVELPVEEGQSVKKNDLLCSLDSTRYKASRDQLFAAKTAAGSQVSVARANLAKAKRDYERAVKLHKKELISDEYLESAQTQLDVMTGTIKAVKDQLAQADAGLRLAGDELAKTVLLSPIDGVIIALNKEAGEIVMGSQLTRDIIMTVADMSAMELVVEVDENDIPDLEIGQEVEIDVDAFAKQKYHGSVTAIGKSAKSTQGYGGQSDETANYDVTVRLTGDIDGLLPGMSATAEIKTDEQSDVLAVPIQCLTMRDPDADPKTPPSQANSEKLKDVVFKVVDGRAEMIIVETGISSEFDMEVTGDLAAEDEIVCGPYKTLNKTLAAGDLLEVGEEKKDGDKKE
jgi:HlyD family secretion protein